MDNMEDMNKAWEILSDMDRCYCSGNMECGYCLKQEEAREEEE
jgi:hypothetical protein